MKSAYTLLFLITVIIVHTAYGHDKARKTQVALRSEAYQEQVETHCKLAFPNPGSSQEKCIQEQSVLMAMKPTGLR